MGGRNPQNKDDFWARKKDEFLQKIDQQSNGQISLFDAQDWTERNGYPSLDPYIIQDNFRNPQYVNPLLMAPQQQMHPQQVNYNYNPNAQMMQQQMYMQQNTMQNQGAAQQQPMYQQQMSMAPQGGQPLLQNPQDMNRR